MTFEHDFRNNVNIESSMSNGLANAGRETDRQTERKKNRVKKTARRITASVKGDIFGRKAGGVYYKTQRSIYYSHFTNRKDFTFSFSFELSRKAFYFTNNQSSPLIGLD